MSSIIPGVDIPFYRYLDTNGDGTGTKNAVLDGSVTPQTIKYTATAFVVIYRMLILIGDSTAPAAGNYGDVATLTNGIDVEVEMNGTTVDLLDGISIKSNLDWARQCYDVGLSSYGTGTNFITVRWTFERAGVPIPMYPGDDLTVTINDDLTGLTDHYFQLQGVDKSDWDDFA